MANSHATGPSPIVYYVYSEDTTSGVQYVVKSGEKGAAKPASGTGSYLSGPYTTLAAANNAAAKDRAKPLAVAGPNAVVYGSNGNRWWTGQNIGQTSGANQTLLGTGSSVNIGKPSGYESLPSGNSGDDAKFAKAALSDAGTSAPVVTSVENISWYNIQGPYTTQKQANAAIPATQAANPALNAAQQAKWDNDGSSLGTIGADILALAPSAKQVAAAAAAAAGGTAKALSSIEDFLGLLTEPNLWIRTAKIVLGGSLLLLGSARLTGLDQSLGPVVKKAAKFAPLL